jgi:hypothetical protein
VCVEMCRVKEYQNKVREETIWGNRRHTSGGGLSHQLSQTQFEQETLDSCQAMICIQWGE